MVLALVAVLVAVTMGGVGQAAAATQPWTQTEFDQEFLKIMRANGMASDPVAEAERALAQAGKQSGTARRLLGGLGKLRTVARVTPKGLGVIGLGALVVDLGFRYGPDLFQHVTGDPDPPTDVQAGMNTTPSYIWVEIDQEASWWRGCNSVGATWGFGQKGRGLVPDGAWVLSQSKTWPSTAPRPHVCQGLPLEAPPSPWVDGISESSREHYIKRHNFVVSTVGLPGVQTVQIENCSHGNSIWGYWAPECFIIYRTAEDMDAQLKRGAVVPWDNQTADVMLDGSAHVPNPDDADVLQRARTFLADPANAEVERYVSWVLDPANNPMPEEMTVQVPMPNPGESATAYRARLQADGWLGSITINVLPEAEPDPRFGPDAVVRVNPSPGTAADPATQPIGITANPATAPQPGGTSTPGASAGGCSPWVEPELKLGAWDIPNDRFPFALLSWVRDGFTGSSGGVAPSFELEVGGKKFTVDLAVANPAMDVLRPTLAALALLSLVWWLGTSMMGLRGRGEGD